MNKYSVILFTIAHLNTKKIKIAHRTPCVLLFLGIKMTQIKIDTLSACQKGFAGSLTIEKKTEVPYTAS